MNEVMNAKQLGACDLSHLNAESISRSRALPGHSSIDSGACRAPPAKGLKQ